MPKNIIAVRLILIYQVEKLKLTNKINFYSKGVC